MSINTENCTVSMNSVFPGLPLVAAGLIGIVWALIAANNESWKTTLGLLRLATGWTVLGLLVTAQHFRKADVAATGGSPHALTVYR